MSDRNQASPPPGRTDAFYLRAAGRGEQTDKRGCRVCSELGARWRVGGPVVAAAAGAEVELDEAVCLCTEHDLRDGLASGAPHPARDHEHVGMSGQAVAGEVPVKRTRFVTLTGATRPPAAT